MHSLRDVVTKVDETVAALKTLRADFTGSEIEQQQLDRLIEHLESESRQLRVDWDGPNIAGELALDDFYPPGE